ncbi:HIT domain-containing protein [Halorubrum ezzemoulense]|uniref:HIT domain-containing protein n=1 Tax=Halorubrum ezzemoulense TaxID=337243 RepID=UPI00232D5E73|nr:HIT domain-containing protein [Halorubrum ezzemoulense]MDB2224705.1 HIT domain-containing protein [Halorubrum ezzemoulense]MDB2275069.1 HIT domain-containing protein [Halorubrum ezzemoulense]
MSDDCIFCSIVAGDVPARTVYETDSVLAFLDANPLARGHTLVIPKSHAHHVGDLDADLASDLFGAAASLTPEIQAAVGADGANVGVNDGEAAGQEVPHVHVHVVPRFEGDGGAAIHAVAGGRPDLSDDGLDAVADEVAAAIDG